MMNLIKKNYKLLKTNSKHKQSFITTNVQFVFKQIRSNFCTNTSENKDNYKRYDHEFESPENQDLTFKTIIERVSLFLIKASAISIFFYLTFLKKYNEISKERELYFINEDCENWLSNIISQKIQKKFSNVIYKDDTEENHLVNKLYTEILEKNKIKVLNKKVFVLKLPNIGCFLLKNGDLFVSSSLLDLASGEEELAFMISHEISLIINGKFFKRILNSYIYHKFFNSIGNIFTQGGLTKNKIDYSENKVSEYLQLNFFLNFYPENPNISFFEHVPMFRVTLKLLENAGYDLLKSIEIIKKLEKKFINYHLISLSGGKYKEYRYYNSLFELINNKL